MSYDTMLDPKNTQGKALITDLVNNLRQISYGVADLARSLKLPGHLAIMGSESLDDPRAVLTPVPSESS